MSLANVVEAAVLTQAVQSRIDNVATLPNGTGYKVRPQAPITLEQHRQLRSLDQSDLGCFGVSRKEFSTGSYGWYGTFKVDVVVDGINIPCQVNVQAVVINSKPSNGNGK